MTDTKKIEEMFSDDDSDLNEIMNSLGINLEELEEQFQNYTPKKSLYYEKVSDDVADPFYNYPSDSGFDLHSTQDLEIEPFGRLLVPTGLKFDIPDGTEIQVRPKSGLAINQGLTVLNTPGTIDSGYNGEIHAILFNTNNYSVKIPKGMKVGQAVLCPVINGKWVDLIKVDSVEDKDRGSNGFGSTGIY
jgi:dUTP pyrophosphatase